MRRFDCRFDPFMPDVNYTVRDAVKGMTAHAIWLIQTTNIDALRLDAAKHIEKDLFFFLRQQIYEKVATTGERFYLMGETLADRATINDYIVHEGKTGLLLDGQVDEPLMFAIWDAFFWESQSLWHIRGQYETSYNYFPRWAVMVSFLGSHDKPRAISMLNGNDTSQNAAWNNPPPVVTDPVPYAKLRLAFAFMFTVPGIPLVYYGDEFGMEGAADPGNRKMMRFDGYNSEQTTQVAFMKKLMAARNGHKAFRYGGVPTTLVIEDWSTGGDYWAYAMQYENDKTVVLFNRAASSVNLHVPVNTLGWSNGTVLQNLLDTDGPIDTVTVNNGYVDWQLPGRSVVILAP